MDEEEKCYYLPLKALRKGFHKMKQCLICHWRSRHVADYFSETCIPQTTVYSVFKRRLRVPPSLVFSRPHILFSDPLERLQFLKEEYCSMPVCSVVSDYDPVDCSPPVSSVQGIFQARVLEWIAIAYSKHCTIFFFKVH